MNSRVGLASDSVTVIGFSAGVADHEVEACHEAGMTDWIAKPLDIRALYAALARAQDSRRDAGRSVVSR